MKKDHHIWDKMKTNYKIMRDVIEENVKHPKGAGDQILEAIKKKDEEVEKLIDEWVRIYNLEDLSCVEELKQKIQG